MTSQRKAAWYGNTKAANIKQLQRHFTQAAAAVKLEFLRMVAWLTIAKG